MYTMYTMYTIYLNGVWYIKYTILKNDKTSLKISKYQIN